MYQQKFNPYGQFPSKSSQLYEDDEQEEDEPLVEEVDSNYEPTDKEVKQYAIDTLGMTFPGDQNLLYLAREGLKAPLPPNWVPYQSRNGEVYYKHRITQEKTYDHPTDIEYQKKYIQQKEKMARTNLKSMNMKANTQLAMAANSNLYGNSSNPFPSKLNNSGLNSESSNIGQEASKSVINIKLDPRLQEEWKEQVEMLEQKLKRQWREIQEEERQKHQKKMKKFKQEYQNQLERLFRNKGSESKIEDKLREQKQRLKNQIQDNLNNKLQHELKQYEKELESKMTEFVAVYEEDNKLKNSKYQSLKDHQFQKLEQKYIQNAEKAREVKDRKKKEREEMLSKLKVDLQKGHNQQIQRATIEALDQELVQIRQTFASKLKEKENQLQRQYDEMKKILGFDQSSYITEIASKKARMKKISEQKLQSIKRKQIQVLTSKFTKDLQQSSQKMKQKVQLEFSKKLAQERHRQEVKLQRQKQKLDQQIKMKSERQLENIYDELKLKIKTYETDMNKKLSTLNQKFISDIVQPKKGTNADLTVRLELKQKQMTLENKTQMIASLKRQKQLENITFSLLKLQSQLSKCQDSHEVDMKLMKLAKNYDLQYRSQEYLRYQASFKEMKNKYKKDKDYLASVMNSLQTTYKGSGIGGAAVLKQYNQDVRVMRENDERLKKYELLLKKAQINDKIALNELSKNVLEYTDIQLRRQMGKPTKIGPSALQELSEQNFHPKPELLSNSNRDVDSALRQHSKFLTTMRHELNRKLYKLRGSTYY